MNETPQVVTIAGSDSGGGAGLQADLKTFQAREVFGMSIVLAITAQNTYGVQAAYALPSDIISAQFQSLAADFKIRAAKTGMLADIERVETVVANLKQVDFGPLVVDPVMIAKGGHPLLSRSAIETIRQQLLPLASVLTPNIPEAEKLSGQKITNQSDMVKVAKILQDLGPKTIILKGGHAQGQWAADYVLLESGQSFWMTAPRIQTTNTHGTGDTFSSCLVAELAKGSDIVTAIKTSKAFIQAAISCPIHVGHGHGPTNHWAHLDESKILYKSDKNHSDCL